MTKKILVVLFVVLLIVVPVMARASTLQTIIWPGDKLYVYCHNGILSAKEAYNTVIVICATVENK